MNHREKKHDASYKFLIKANSWKMTLKLKFRLDIKMITIVVCVNGKCLQSEDR